MLMNVALSGFTRWPFLFAFRIIVINLLLIASYYFP